MYNLNFKNTVFGQFDWNGRFPEGRIDFKKKFQKSKQKPDHGES